MLGAGGGLQSLSVALESADEGCAQPGGEVRVLAVGLVSAPPAGVPEDVDVGRPHREPVVDIPVSLRGEGVVLGSGLGGDRGGNGLQQLVVKHGGHADGLREARGGAAAGQAVEGFVPPVVGRNAEPFNGRRVEAELPGHFFHRHAVHQPDGQFSCLRAGHGPSSFLSFMPVV